MKKTILLSIVLAVGMLLFAAPSATYVNPLSRLAEFNLGTLNQFANETDVNDWPVKGMLYQWGRNVPFSSENVPVETITMLPNLNSEEVWGTKFITSTAGNWYNGGSITDVWKDSVNTNYGAPASYVGTNNGDPSPVGYHVPSDAELKAIVPIVKIDGAGELLGVTEAGVDVDGSGVLVSYTSDYNSPTKGILAYALRFKGTVHATAFKYEWEVSKGLKITAKQATAGLTISDIAGEDFEWSGAIVRLIPITPYRLNTTGVYTTINQTMYYYSSTGSVSAARAANWLLAAQLPRLGTLLRANAAAIRPMKDYDPGIPTTSPASKSVKNFEVYSTDGGVVINVLKPTPIKIYDIYGSVVFYKESLEEKFFVSLQKGIYIMSGSKFIVH